MEGKRGKGLWNLGYNGRDTKKKKKKKKTKKKKIVNNGRFLKAKNLKK